MESINTPIKNSTSTSSSQSIINTPVQSNQDQIPITTPVNNNNNNYSTYNTPIANSPFINTLTPVSETKRLYDLSSSDVLPMKSSTNDKNVHSPPKNSITLGEVRLICEHNLLSLNPDIISNISNSTNNKKKQVIQWFYNEWFSSNNDIDTGIILRTVFSVFCSLRSDGKLNDQVANEFQLFWNGLKKEKRSRRVSKKIKKKVKIKNQDQFDDIADSFIS